MIWKIQLKQEQVKRVAERARAAANEERKRRACEGSVGALRLKRHRESDQNRESEPRLVIQRARTEGTLTGPNNVISYIWI